MYPKDIKGGVDKTSNLTFTIPYRCMNSVNGRAGMRNLKNFIFIKGEDLWCLREMLSDSFMYSDDKISGLYNCLSQKYYRMHVRHYGDNTPVVPFLDFLFGDPFLRWEGSFFSYYTEYNWVCDFKLARPSDKIDVSCYPAKGFGFSINSLTPKGAIKVLKSVWKVGCSFDLGELECSEFDDSDYTSEEIEAGYRTFKSELHPFKVDFPLIGGGRGRGKRPSRGRVRRSGVGRRPIRKKKNPGIISSKAFTPFATEKMVSQRIKGVVSIPKGLVIPNAVLVDFVYMDYTNPSRNNAGHPSLTYRYNMNSIHEFDPTGVTTIYGTGFWSAGFYAYRVLSCHWELEIDNRESFPINVFVLPITNDPGPNDANVDTYPFQPYCVTRSISASTGMDKVVLRGNYDLGSLLGSPEQYIADPGYGSLFTTSPAIGSYLSIGVIAPANLVNGIYTNFRCLLRTLVTEKKDLTS